MKKCKINNFSRHSKIVSNCDSIIKLSYILTAVVSLGNTAAEASSSLTIKKNSIYQYCIIYHTLKLMWKLKYFFVRQDTYTIGANDAFETKWMDSSMVIRKVNQHKLRSIP